MIGKVRLILLVAIMAHQIADRVSLANKIHDAIAKLQKVVDAVVAKANKQLNALKARVNALAAQVRNEAKKAMKSTGEIFKKELDALKGKAKAKGANIAECLGKNEKKLVDLPDVAANAMIHCVTDRANEAIRYIQTEVKQAVDDVAAIKQAVKNCRGLKVVECIGKILIKIGKMVVRLPKQITEAFTKAVVIVDNLRPRIEMCALQKVRELEAQGKKILEGMATCAAKKHVGP